VLVVVTADGGVGVELGCPRVGVSTVVGEVADGVTELFIGLYATKLGWRVRIRDVK
jgi:hypothetical protein